MLFSKPLGCCFSMSSTSWGLWLFLRNTLGSYRGILKKLFISSIIANPLRKGEGIPSNASIIFGVYSVCVTNIGDVAGTICFDTGFGYNSLGKEPSILTIILDRLSPIDIQSPALFFQLVNPFCILLCAMVLIFGVCLGLYKFIPLSSSCVPESDIYMSHINTIYEVYTYCVIPLLCLIMLVGLVFALEFNTCIENYMPIVINAISGLDNISTSDFIAEKSINFLINWVCGFIFMAAGPACTFGLTSYCSYNFQFK